MMVKDALASVRYVVDSAGEKIDVLIPLETWQALLAAWEEAPQPTESTGEQAQPTGSAALEIEPAWNTLVQLVEDCAVETDIPDLAHQHDHYLYHKPKRDPRCSESS